MSSSIEESDEPGRQCLRFREGMREQGLHQMINCCLLQLLCLLSPDSWLGHVYPAIYVCVVCVCGGGGGQEKNWLCEDFYAALSLSGKVGEDFAWQVSFSYLER